MDDETVVETPTETVVAEPTPAPEDVVFMDSRHREPRISSATAEANLRRYFDDAEVDENGKKRGWDWYRTEQEHTARAARAIGVDHERFVGMVAATSPRMQWTQNIGVAQKAARFSDDHRDLEGEALHDYITTVDKPGMLRPSLWKAVRIHRGEPIGEVLGEKKTYNFHHNLIDPTGTEDMVTMDIWMHRALLGGRNPSTKEGSYLTDGGYDWSADIVRKIARDVGYAPQHVQAIIWTEIKRTWPRSIPT